MNINKKVRKLRPSDYWRIGEHESWFTDMAAQGLHLQKMGLHFAHFVKGEPQKMKFRIDVAMNKKITPDQIQMYEENGWDFVTSYNYFLVFSSPMNSGAPELHTDPAEQSYTLKDLNKKLAMNASIVVGALLFMIGMLSAIWFLDGTPTYILVQGFAVQQTILTIFFVYLAYNSLQAVFSIRALRKNLIEGKPIDHHAPWKKHYQLNSTIAALITVVVGLSVIIPFTQLIKGETKTLAEVNVNLPIVRLADVEKNSALVRGKSISMINNVDWGNRYTYNWGPFAPVQYETDEGGIVPGEMWADGSGEYSPSIHTSVYQLSVPAMADNLISDLIKRNTYGNSYEDFVMTNHPQLDLLFVHEDVASKEVYASKGKAVIYVRYYGYAEINSIIDNIVEKIHLISE